MGYLDNTSITVDAILTNKGRELLAQGSNAFNITQFALGDDEIEYTLWNPADTRGSAFYGDVIENMPVTEAIPDQTKALKFRLLTLPGNNAQYLPKLVANPTVPSNISGQGGSITITLATLNFPNANSSYTAILSDDSIASLSVPAGAIGGGSSLRASDPGTTSLTSNEKFVITFSANPSTTNTRTVTVTFFGNDTGGETSVSITQLNRNTAVATLASSAS